MMRTMQRQPPRLIAVLLLLLLLVAPPPQSSSVLAFSTTSKSSSPLFRHRGRTTATTIPTCSSFRAFASVADDSPAPDDTQQDDDDNDNSNSLRSSLRQVFGFSLTAFRTTLRGLTGISLTAVYVATLTATGAWIRQTTKAVLSLLPPPVRYFLQPLLVLYYAPLFVLKTATSREQRGRRQQLQESWQSAVVQAENKAASYWPETDLASEKEDDEDCGGDTAPPSPPKGL